ncbi:hypothetical protein DSO57_1039213 [Entomophthora muscae]|uniref:Uncharacterized protein n=1 Tax=Entomophthora muscae TaxID=34485 RepID=A0ACC2UII5_9FUNG|nr:hypothetical protein DSO57_1039213 [Entomophthora muscae]
MSKTLLRSLRGGFGDNRKTLVGQNCLFRVQRVCSAYSTSPDSGPLDGLKVLDLTRVLAGPYCTMLLGDLGAEIIKVERPGLGDDTRAWGPPFAEPKVKGASKESAYYLGVNRNKKSITVDFTKAGGQKILHELALKSDILVENFIPGKLAQYNLDYETLAKINPKLIYASITGYGPTGPYGTKPGYDVMIEAEAGLMYVTGEKDGPPVKVGVAITDLTTGLYAHGAIMASVIRRGITGKGQKVDVSLLESQIASLANLASSYLIGGVSSGRQGTAHGAIVPYQSFATSDGDIVVGAGSDRQFHILCNDIIERPEFLDAKIHPFSSNSLRVANRKSLIEMLSRIFKQQPTSFWLKKFEGKGLPYAPINDIIKTFDHPQVKHRNMIQEIEHPTLGSIRLVGPAVKYSVSGSSIRSPPPTLGQHTHQVLSEKLGLSPEKIAELKEAGII